MRKTFFKKLPVVFMLAMSLLIFPQYAESVNLNCGNTFVSKGTSKVEVLKTCGKPFYQEVVGTITKIIGNTKVEVFIAHWYYTETYRASSTDYILEFHGSELVDIRRSDGRFD